MRRVVFDLTPLATGSRYRGIGTYAVALSRALARAADRGLAGGLDLQVLAGRLALTVSPIASPPPPPDGAALLYPVYYALKHTVHLARLTGAGADLYHATDPKGTPRPPGCRTVVTCHDLIPTVLGPPYRPSWVPERASAAIDRVRYCGPDHVIAISDWTRRDVQRVTGLPDDRVTVVHHGVDAEVYHPRAGPRDASVVAEITGGRPFFLYVGGFDARKQVPELVTAFGRRHREMDAVLVVCGQMRPWHRSRLEAAIAESGAEGRVLLPGFVPGDRIAALYRGALAHVMPSTYEGFGMTIVEAFACGCPVVAADASCVPEIAGGAALLVPPGDGDALGDALVRLARGGSERDRLVRAALDRAAHFTWDRCAEETLAVYRRVLATERA